jgi:hypothetical protein
VLEGPPVKLIHGLARTKQHRPPCRPRHILTRFIHPGAKGACKLIRPRGVLISSNLHFRDAETRSYRNLLFSGGAWLTAAIADGDTALSVRL